MACWCSPVCTSTLRRRWSSAGASARLTTRPTGTIRSPGSTPSRSTSRRTPRPPTYGRPSTGTSTGARPPTTSTRRWRLCSRPCRWPSGAGRPSSPVPMAPMTTSPTTRRSGSPRCASCIRWRPRNAASIRTPPTKSWHAGGHGRHTSTRWCGRTAADASHWCSAPRRTTSSAWNPTRAGRCWRTCSTGPPSPAWCTATTGPWATPSSGTTAACCTARRHTTRIRHARCCAQRCSATSRFNSGALSRCTALSLTATCHYGNLIPTYENHVLVHRDRRNGGRMAEDLTSVDFFRDGRLTDDPYRFYEALRNKCPVSREDHYGVTMVTGWQEAVDVYNDAETFSSCVSVTGPFPGFPVPLEGDDVTELIVKHRDDIPFSDQLPTLDPPTHTNHRALLMRLITPKRLKENEDAMWQLADDILDDFLAAGEGEFISDFAGPFTLRIIADLLGVPEEDRPELLERLARGTHGSGLGNADKTQAKTPLEYLYEVFATYVEDRRREPRDDVLTGLATATFPDGTMPEVGDVVRVATNVFSAGQETTVRLLSTALKVMGDRPDIQQKLREDRSLLPNFIEECLRIESPVKGDFRLSRVPTTVGNQSLGAGCTVMVINGAANRDPRRFEEPDTFDPERKNARQHLAFGRGIHSCPGAPLARAETRVGLERLLDRTTDIRISEEKHGPVGQRRYSYIPTYILRGLTELHLEFDL